MIGGLDNIFALLVEYTQQSFTNSFRSGTVRFNAIEQFSITVTGDQLANATFWPKFGLPLAQITDGIISVEIKTASLALRLVTGGRFYWHG